MIRIALRSDRRLFRDALAVCLDARPECSVVGNVADLDDLPVLCRLRSPDLVLVDIGQGIGTGPETVGRLRDCTTRARVVVIYERLSSAELAVFWQIGVDTLLPCSHGLDALLTLLQRYIAAESDRPTDRAKVKDGLSEQDAKILALLTAGHTVDQISNLLEVSTSAVANAKRRIYRKLEVASQCQAVARATALGILRQPRRRSPESGRTPGRVVALLRGPAGPVRDRVGAALLAGGVPVLAGSNGSGSNGSGSNGSGSNGSGSNGSWSNGSWSDGSWSDGSWSNGSSEAVRVEPDASLLVVLVDPAPGDWPSGHESELPVALVRSAPLHRVEVLEAMQRGVVAVVAIDRVGIDLVPALSLISRGYLAVEAAAAGALLDAVRAPAAATARGLPELTPRECDILRSIAIGDTVRLTARALGIAEKTVENTQARLFRKLGARNRPGALAAAHALGLLDHVGNTRPPT